MLIAHLADTHLGHRHLHHLDDQGRNLREQDFYAAFDAAIDAILQLQPVAVVHAGDLFDSYHPSTQALNVALDGLARLREAAIPFVAIAGNHSTPRQRNTEHVYALLARFGGHHLIWEQPRTIRLGELAIHGVPHQHDAKLLAAQIAAASADSNAKYNVLLLHGGFETLPQVGAGEPGSITLDPEALEAAAEFDYIALGHLHLYQAIRDNACYAGSLERINFADTAPRKGFVVVDLSRDRYAADRLRLNVVPTRAFFELPPIDAAGADDPLDLIELALTDHDLDGAIVRCRLVNVDQADWRALDRQRLAELTRSCLHFELLPLFEATTATAVGAPADLRAFVTAHTPHGLKVEQLLVRTEDYLARAASEGTE
jgi:DNA repair protein SbcD/Mre11